MPPTVMDAQPGPVPLVPKGGSVCIVGGGTSGVLAAKNCLDEGLVPTVYEQTYQVGGVWRQGDEPHRVAYDSLYTNSSGCMMNISDFPLSGDLQGEFPRRQDICDYYDAYVEQFKLRPYIQFGTEVVSIRKSGNHWYVTTSRNQIVDSGVFDAVFVSTGQFRDPMMPPLRGIDGFHGRIRHSAEYRNADDLKGKKVVIVGNGNSALDISLEAACNGCASVIICCRSGTNVIPVADANGRPVDQLLTTRFFQALPASLRGLFFLRLVSGTNAVFQKHGMPKPNGPAGSMGFSNLKEHIEYRRLLREGKIQMKAGELQSLTANSVVLSSGEELLADEVVLCTGYRLSFPFLDPELAEGFMFGPEGHKHLNAYKLIMHPKEPTLCGLGFLLTFGNESCVAEMQARWALAHWLGRVSLPSTSAMKADLDRRRKSGKYPHFVPYIKYLDDLARDCGIDPPLSWRLMLQHPKLFWKLQAGPVVPAQYRLRGGHAWPEAANFIRNVPSVTTRMAQLLWTPPDSASARPAARPRSKL